MKYYVYRHYIGNNTFYVGKGSGNRAYSTKRNTKWHEFVKDEKFNVEIVKYFDNNKDAYAYEAKLTQYYKNLGQCEANITIGAKKDEVTKSKLSIAVSKAVSGEKHPMFGRSHSEAARRKISMNHARLNGENHPMFGITGGNHPRAKQRVVSINGIAYSAECKKDMQKLLLNECNINASGRFINGQVPKKYRDIVDYIEVEGKIIYSKK